MADGCHVGCAAVGPQAHQIVVEDDVEHPVEAASMPQWARTARAKVGVSSSAEER